MNHQHAAESSSSLSPEETALIALLASLAVEQLIEEHMAPIISSPVGACA